MKNSMLIASSVVLGLAAAAALSPAFAQFKGGLYAFHSRPDGKCPGLDWHLTLEPNGQLVGFVAWDQMKHMARLSGMLNKDGDFDMAAVSDSGKKATVKGAASGDYITASIVGSGTACDQKVLQIPRATGGLEGGGG